MPPLNRHLWIQATSNYQTNKNVFVTLVLFFFSSRALLLFSSPTVCCRKGDERKWVEEEWSRNNVGLHAAKIKQSIAKVNIARQLARGPTPNIRVLWGERVKTRKAKLLWRGLMNESRGSSSGRPGVSGADETSEETNRGSGIYWKNMETAV